MAAPELPPEKQAEELVKRGWPWPMLLSWHQWNGQRLVDCIAAALRAERHRGQEPRPPSLGDLKDDELIALVVRKVGMRAKKIAEEQSGETLEEYDFLWGFWLGFAYERAGAIAIVEKCQREGHVASGAPAADEGGDG